MRHFLLPDLGEGLEEAEIVAWHVTEGDHVVSEIIVPYRDGVSQAASFFELRDGLIAHIVEYWIDFGQQAPPEYRAAWVEPLTPE